MNITLQDCGFGFAWELVTGSLPYQGNDQIPPRVLPEKLRLSLCKARCRWDGSISPTFCSPAIATRKLHTGCIRTQGRVNYAVADGLSTSCFNRRRSRIFRIGTLARFMSVQRSSSRQSYIQQSSFSLHTSDRFLRLVYRRQKFL